MTAPTTEISPHNSADFPLRGATTAKQSQARTGADACRPPPRAWCDRQRGPDARLHERGATARGRSALARLLPVPLPLRLSARVLALVAEDGQVHVQLVHVVARAQLMSEEDELWERDHSARSD